MVWANVWMKDPDHPVVRCLVSESDGSPRGDEHDVSGGGEEGFMLGKTPFADEASRWPQAPCVMVELQEPYLLWLNGTTPTLEDVVNAMGGLGEGGWGEAEVSNLYNDSFKNVWQVHLYISSMKVMVTGVTTSWRLCSYASFRGMCCQVFRKMASTHMYSP